MNMNNDKLYHTASNKINKKAKTKKTKKYGRKNN